MDRITATYFIETPFSPEKAAEILAGEQSSGTFVAVPGETAELKERFAAKVELVEVTGLVRQPSIPSDKNTSSEFRQGIVKVSWSVENFGYNLPVLISTLQGNLYELRQFTGLKLMDIDFPDNYVQHFRGPRFGIKGCRK